MPWGLQRFHQSRQSHFITFSCYERRPLLATNAAKRTFENALERVRRTFGIQVYGYVVMPEHVHLLLSEPLQPGVTFNSSGAPLKPSFGLNGEVSLATAIKSLKQGVSRRLIGEADHFWQKRYYDFNIRNHAQFVEKLRYIHRNPVKLGLCERPEDWEWSSFRHYATGCAGRVEIESEWTARARERTIGTLCPPLNCPTQAKRGLEWAT